MPLGPRGPRGSAEQRAALAGGLFGFAPGCEDSGGRLPGREAASSQGLGRAGGCVWPGPRAGGPSGRATGGVLAASTPRAKRCPAMTPWGPRRQQRHGD